MDDTLTSEVNSGYRYLGIYQLIGGLTGYVMLLLLIASMDMATIVSLVLLIAAVFLFGYSTFCGALLLRKRSAGIQHSLINQYLQLVSFGIGGYAYKFSAGVHVLMGYGNEQKIIVEAGISTYETRFASDDKHIFLELNVVAFIIILLLNRFKRKVEEQETRMKIAELGS